MSDQIPPATCVIVSGGSRGLGLAIVEDLLESDVSVATFSRRETPAIADLLDRHPGQFFFDEVDATSHESLAGFVHRAEENLGIADGIVNNAAVGQDSLHLHTRPEYIEEIIRTNQVAPLLLTRAFLRRATLHHIRPRVVFITSICARRGYSGLVAYSSTKGGLEAAARSLARELHGRALVNCVAPGFFESEMSSSLGDEQLAAIQRRTPTGRLATTKDVLPVIRLLLLENTNINGQVITLDGGGSI